MMSNTASKAWIFIIILAAVHCGFGHTLAEEIEPRLRLKASSDKGISPYTGYTREHWIEIAGRIIAGFLPYFDNDTGIR